MDARHYFASDLHDMLPRSRVAAFATQAGIALSTIGSATVSVNLPGVGLLPHQGLLIEACGFMMLGTGGTSVTQRFQLLGYNLALADSGNIDLIPLGDGRLGSTGSVQNLAVLHRPNTLVSLSDLAALFKAGPGGGGTMATPFKMRFLYSALNTDAAGTLDLRVNIWALYRVVNGFAGGD